MPVVCAYVPLLEYDDESWLLSLELPVPEWVATGHRFERAPDRAIVRGAGAATLVP